MGYSWRVCMLHGKSGCSWYAMMRGRNAGSKMEGGAGILRRLDEFLPGSAPSMWAWHRCSTCRQSAPYLNGFQAIGVGGRSASAVPLGARQVNEVPGRQPQSLAVLLLGYAVVPHGGLDNHGLLLKQQARLGQLALLKLVPAGVCICICTCPTGLQYSAIRWKNPAWKWQAEGQGSEGPISSQARR